MKKIKSLLTKYREVINYLIVGILTTVVSLGVFYACTNTFLDGKKQIRLQIANIISWIVSVLFAYISNRKYVFRSKNDKVLKELLSFSASRLLTLVLYMGLMLLFTEVILLNYNFSKIIVQLVIIVLNYILSKLIVFKRTLSDS